MCMWLFFCHVFNFSDVTFIFLGFCLFVLGQKSVSSKTGSEHLTLLFYHSSPDKNHHVCTHECTLYNQKCVSFSSEPPWLPNTTQMAVWGTVSRNGNRECAINVSLKHLPETCWCVMCRKIFSNSHFLGSKKCYLYSYLLNFFGLSIEKCLRLSTLTSLCTY